MCTCPDVDPQLDYSTAVSALSLQGYGVIGSTEEGPEEIEHAPSLSITLASLPGVDISVQHVTSQQLPDGGALGMGPPADNTHSTKGWMADNTHMYILVHCCCFQSPANKVLLQHDAAMARQQLYMTCDRAATQPGATPGPSPTCCCCSCSPAALRRPS